MKKLAILFLSATVAIAPAQERLGSRRRTRRRWVPRRWGRRLSRWSGTVSAAADFTEAAEVAIAAAVAAVNGHSSGGGRGGGAWRRNLAEAVAALDLAAAALVRDPRWATCPRARP